jgi:hypothetical protein
VVAAAYRRITQRCECLKGLGSIVLSSKEMAQFSFWFLITPRGSDTEQVIFEAGRHHQHPVLTIGLDELSHVFARVHGAAGNPGLNVRVDASRRLGRDTVLCVELTRSASTSLKVLLEGQPPMIQSTSTTFDGVIALRCVLGCDLRGERPASFAIRALRPLDHRGELVSFKRT